MQQHALALDLKDDPALIAEYEAWHRAVWPEITKSIRYAGIESLKIWRAGNRLFMLIETDDDFSFEKSRRRRGQSARRKMGRADVCFQPLLAAPGEKWVRMTEVFDLNR